jgi:hypothetical protein
LRGTFSTRFDRPADVHGKAKCHHISTIVVFGIALRLSLMKGVLLMKFV